MDQDWIQIAARGTDRGRNVSTMVFDTVLELVWVGDNAGRVVSYMSRDLQLYTAFRIQPTQETSPVYQILIHEKGVIAVGARSVHMSTRRGPALWNIRHSDMKELRCMTFTSKSANEILVAGLQRTMFVIDVAKGEIVKRLPTDCFYTMMRKGRYICAATQTGDIDLIDSNTLAVAKTWSLPSNSINDMDTQGEYVVACGCSHRPSAPNGFIFDTYVSVFDLKNMLSMQPIPFPPTAANVRLHPKMLTTSIVASQHGQMHVVDIMNPSQSVRHANLNYMTMFEIAPSGEAIVVADGENNIRLWGSPNKIRFTDQGVAVEPPPMEDPIPPAPREWDADLPLNCTGVPYYRETLFSALPPDLVCDTGAPPPQIDPALLATLKPSEFGLYGRNTRSVHRNQFEDTRATGKTTGALQPMFLSEKAKEGARSSRLSKSELEAAYKDSASSLLSNNAVESLKPEAPIMYRNLEIKYSKFGVDDFDFGFYNQTEYAGLENHISNSYANSLLQVMHYTPLLRNLALQHAATACLVDPCMLCELGYLFDMLQKAEKSSCQATNLLRALSSIPTASQQGVLEDSGHPPNTLIQNLTKFLFERIHSEYRSIPPASVTLEGDLFRDLKNLIKDPPQVPDPKDLVSKVLATSAEMTIKCQSCKSESTRPGTSYMHDLLYPANNKPAYPITTKSTNRGPRAPQITFSRILKMGVEREANSKGWCNRCNRYQTLATKKTIHSVPTVLAINTVITQPDHRKLWATPSWLPEEIGVIINGGHLYCYEGADLKLHLQRNTHPITVYSLTGMVVNIECPAPEKPHLVAMVNAAHSDPVAPAESKWHLVNDFSVRPVSFKEATTFNASWKLPSVLVYQVKAANNRSNLEWKTNMDTSILYQPLTSKGNIGGCEVLDMASEKPGPQTTVALDTEFVSLKQAEIQVNAGGDQEVIRPMMHALARVSVIRGDGSHEGQPFIDDYIAIREPVMDYLTTFSGIRPEDLDSQTTQHHLVSLKVAYKKLWVLLNLGVTFLGHGLKQDWRVINIKVPRAQIIDTSELFSIRGSMRKLALSFLAWAVLNINVQMGNHDSIEDAKAALRLYRKYQEYQDAGIFEQMQSEISKKGQLHKWKAPGRDKETPQRTDTPDPTVGETGPVAGPSTPVRNSGVGVAEPGSAGFGMIRGFTPGRP